MYAHSQLSVFLSLYTNDFVSSMLKAEIGGHKLTSLPGSANKQSLGVRQLSIGAMIPAGGSACLRRETGNYVCLYPFLLSHALICHTTV